MLRKILFLNKSSYSLFRYGLVPLPKFLIESAFEHKKLNLLRPVGGKAIKNFLQNAGPLYIKLGQILALREDLLGEEICNELSALFSNQKPMKIKEFKRQVKNSGVSLKNFKDIDKKPLGVGSIGQVHLGRLRSGQEIIIKVKRKKIAEKLLKDEANLYLLFEILYLISPQKRHSEVKVIEKMTKEMVENIKKELNFELEAQSLKDFDSRFFKNPKVVFPKLYEKYSNKDILVMEYLKGDDLDQFKKRKDISEAKKKEIADIVFKEILGEIFNYGKFHGDPHAGNFIVLENGKLGIIDLGLTGEFNKKDRDLIVRAIKSFLAKDIEGTMKTLLGFGEIPADFNYEEFKKDIKKIFEQHKEHGLGLEKFVTDLFSCAYSHNIFVPTDTSLLIKTLVTTEGLVRSLDPDFKVGQKAIPIVLSSWFKRLFS